MVEDRGFEPVSGPYPAPLTTGQVEYNGGRKRARTGHNTKGCAESDVKKRTQTGQPPNASRTPSDHSRIHNRAITEWGLDSDLQAVVDAWPDLPEAVRAGILAMVRAAGKPTKK